MESSIEKCRSLGKATPHTQEAIEDAMCDLQLEYGPDRHTDGYEELAAFAMGLLESESAMYAALCAVRDAYFDPELTNHNKGIMHTTGWMTKCMDALSLARSNNR